MPLCLFLVAGAVSAEYPDAEARKETERMFGVLHPYLLAITYDAVASSCRVVPDWEAKYGVALSTWRKGVNMAAGRTAHLELLASNDQSPTVADADAAVAGIHAEFAARPAQERTAYCESLAAEVLDLPRDKDGDGKVDYTDAQEAAFRMYQVSIEIAEKVAICADRVPGWGAEFGTAFPAWIEKEKSGIAEGEGLYHAMLDANPNGRSDAEMSVLGREDVRKEMALYQRPDEIEWACRRIGRALAGLPEEHSPRPSAVQHVDATNDYFSPLRTFVFSPPRFAAAFPKFAEPLTIEQLSPYTDGEDSAEFTTGGFIAWLRFTVGSVPGTDLAKTEASLEKSVDAAEVRRGGTCQVAGYVLPCIQVDGTDQGALPAYIVRSVAFVAHGRVFQVSVSNWSGTYAQRDQAWRARFTIEGATADTEAAMRAFLAALRPLP